MLLTAAASCDCAAPMLSNGWTIAAAGVALVGSAVAVERSRRAAVRHRDDGVDLTDPRPEGGQQDDSHDQAGDLEPASPSSRRGVGVTSEVVNTLTDGT